MPIKAAVVLLVLAIIAKAFGLGEGGFLILVGVVWVLGAVAIVAGLAYFVRDAIRKWRGRAKPNA